MKTSVPGLIIRRSCLNDLHDIYMLGLGDETFSAMNSRWNPSELAAVFSGDGALAYTAARKKEVAGFIIGTVSGEKAEILWILVKEKFRRRGIGSALLEMFMDKLKKEGITDFCVALFPDSAETEKFFCKNSLIQRESYIKLSGKL